MRGKVAVVFTYPNTEKIAMADPHFQALYGRFSLRHDLTSELTFIPDQEHQPLLARHRRPLDEVFTWDHLGTGKERLLDAYRKACLA